mgnify:CR=1 FL=1
MTTSNTWEQNQWDKTTQLMRDQLRTENPYPSVGEFIKVEPPGVSVVKWGPVNSAHYDGAALGIGGAPTRATTLPEGAAERKTYPVASGVLDYFPDAIAAVAHVSWAGNEQHNPGKPLHWDRSKSADEADTMLRHFAARGTLDTDGQRHAAKMAWRALAILQK